MMMQLEELNLSEKTKKGLYHGKPADFFQTENFHCVEQ